MDSCIQESRLNAFERERERLKNKEKDTEINTKRISEGESRCV